MKRGFAAFFTTWLTILSLAYCAYGEPALPSYLARVPAADLFPGATGYGTMRADIPAAPVMMGDRKAGWVFLNSDLAAANGYSGRPINVLIAMDEQGIVRGARMMDQSEPLLQNGRRRSQVEELVEGFAGRDLKAELASGGSGVKRLYLSGVSVSTRVIEDTLVRSGLKVAFALELDGFEKPVAPEGTVATLDANAVAPQDWNGLLKEGSVGRLQIGVGQINAAFATPGNPPKAANHPVEGKPEDYFIDLYAAQVSVPGLAKVLLRDVYQADLGDWLEPGDTAILIAGNGLYSFRQAQRDTGLMTRIALVQGDRTFRLNSRDQLNLFRITAEGAPSLSEISMFKIPSYNGFDPAQPWRLELLVERRMGAIARAYLSFDLTYRLPERYIKPAWITPAMQAQAEAEAERRAAIERRNGVWLEKRTEIAVLAVMLSVLTAVYFFQNTVSRSARFLYWFRMGFLTVTLVFLGWYANAQLSVVNIMALAVTAANGFDWEIFLIDPLTFILWFSVAAALVFWGRGAYCGWLCPFGALQELSNQIARALRVPQVRLPWGLHERLWAVKYLIFLGLAGAFMVSFGLGLQLAEVEPFRTAIIMRFARAWPFLLYVTVLLGIGLFVERFYCRYLCPLGAALAIPARLRMFDWLRRYRECGNPCMLCTDGCFVQAINPLGEISANECLGCLHCQTMYQSSSQCPVVIRRNRRRASDALVADPMATVRRRHSDLPEEPHQ